MIKPLFAVELAPPSSGLEGFKRVTHTHDFVQMFRWLYERQAQVLYNHSPIYPFSYLNQGKRQLYVKYDWGSKDIIPVCQKADVTPSFTIHTPRAPVAAILEVVEKLDKVSSQPVKITDVTEAYADDFLSRTTGWEKVKTSDDVIYDTAWIVKLEGSELASVRNKIKKAQALRPRLEHLSAANKNDALYILRRWKETQGTKHFRVTIGRDIRLVEEYADKVAFKKHFGLIAYLRDSPVAMSYGCRSDKDPSWGMQITRKALIVDGQGNKLVGWNDFIMYQLIQTMHSHGILHVNDSGFYGPGVKANKLKWSGGSFTTIPMFDLRRQASKNDNPGTKYISIGGQFETGF